MISQKVPAPAAQDANGTPLNSVVYPGTSPTVGASGQDRVAPLQGGLPVLDTNGNVAVAPIATVLRDALSNKQVVIAAHANADALASGSTVYELLVASLGLDFNGATWDRRRVASVFKTIAAVAVTASTPVTLWTPTSGKKFRLMGYALSSSAAAALIFKDGGNAHAEMVRTPLLAAAGVTTSPPMGNGILGSAANGVLELDVTTNSTVSGFVFGVEE